MAEKLRGSMSKLDKARIDLKREELHQIREIEMKKIELEEKKWEHDKQRDADFAKQVKQIAEGPIGRAIENIGSGAADRIRSGKGNSVPLVKVQCPKCGGIFSVSPALPEVYCTNCGEKLSRSAEIEWKCAKQGEAPKEEDALDKWLKVNMQRIRDELLVALIEADKEKLRLLRQAPEKKDVKDPA